ncbi:hypothetical protein N7G274_009679 [Stereocaulon virgatum]|uniref:LYR motif-containing protein Cup1-like N-terminal domain-containing protein n=1 Tax=Stereocaulon virgatum TaxID=373712 RepID=A0ABR3ZXY5_9LECA
MYIINIEREQILHLFRALLRQCTYLPDPAARNHLHSHIVSRFRDYHPSNIKSKTNRDGKPVRLVQQRRPTLIKTAKKGLKYLQRANDGHPLHLGKILSMTYGRIGKGRHLLLKNLRLPDVPVDEVAKEILLDPREQGVPHPSQQLTTLIGSQRRQKLLLFPGRRHPTQAPKIPAKNKWGRPMPVKRVRNMKRRWYAESLDRVMPPLPEEDWNRLQKLVSGETPWEGPVPRRGPDKVVGFKRDLMRYPRLLSSPHTITARYMRRLWGKIFVQCPVMRVDASRKTGWEVKWGNAKAAPVFGLRNKNDESMSPMFEGVNEKGGIVEKRNEGLEWTNPITVHRHRNFSGWEELRDWKAMT